MTEPEEPILPEDKAEVAEATAEAETEVFEAAGAEAAELDAAAVEAWTEVFETGADAAGLDAAAAEAESEVFEAPGVHAAAVDAVAAADGDEDGDEDEDDAEEDALAPPAVPAAQALTGAVKPAPGKGPRPDLIDRRDPLYRECKGYRLRLDPPDLARLRELPGSRGKSDDEIGEAFFDGQAERLASAIADDVPTPSEIRVVVDPYSRQAFLALENRIRGILSF